MLYPLRYGHGIFGERGRERAWNERATDSAHRSKVRSHSKRCSSRSTRRSDLRAGAAASRRTWHFQNHARILSCRDTRTGSSRAVATGSAIGPRDRSSSSCFAHSGDTCSREAGRARTCATDQRNGRARPGARSRGVSSECRCTGVAFCLSGHCPGAPAEARPRYTTSEAGSNRTSSPVLEHSSEPTRRGTRRRLHRSAPDPNRRS